MSRIGKNPIFINSTTKINIENNKIIIQGPKGTLSYNLSPDINVEYSKEKIQIYPNNNNKITQQLYGLSRTIINNMVIGVTTGFSKDLEIQGIGYRAQTNSSNNLILNVGYSHPIEINIPENISIKIENGTLIQVHGISKEQVGQLAAKIRSIRPPEPYKGKGIRYKYEKVRKKVGKAGK